jgi:peptidyl-dipeptidase A
MKKILFSILLFTVGFTACQNNAAVQKEVQLYLDKYTKEYLKLYTISSEASWMSLTSIKKDDTTYTSATNIANEAMAQFTGSEENIMLVKKYLALKDKLTPIQVKQLEVILLNAGNNPATVKALVTERIKAETAQSEILYGYQYKIGNKKVSTNDIDEILRTETNEAKRLMAWEASKEVGKELKKGLANLRDKRNKTVQALDYMDFYSYQVSEYGMTANEMNDLMKKLNNELRPLYRELHTYARYELAKKYNAKEVPDYIPAHWLPNRCGQDWSSMVIVKGLDLDEVLKSKTKEWILKEGENFYTSLGFNSLPKSFWEKSNLYPYPSDSNVKKNNHASAWHMDLQNDVRSLMSVEPNSEWFETANHELGHIYYYMTYSTNEVPPLLRGGANRAYHEAMGTLMGLAAMRKPYLIGRGLIPANTTTDSIQLLLKEAMNSVIFIPFSAGTMSAFEKQIYSDNLDSSKWNATWWNLVKKYQGIEPPTNRGEKYCDAATKTHINDDAAQYYDYALSYILLFQLNKHIAQKILHQSITSNNYYGNKEVGNFLREIMKTGAAKDWRIVLKETTGEDFNATAMLEYFNPLTKWLQEQNKGRKYTLPETIE